MEFAIDFIAFFGIIITKINKFQRFQNWISKRDSGRDGEILSGKQERRKVPRRKKEINIRLVAEKAGVSVATVSRVLNNRTDVSEPVRRRVSEMIEKFNFLPTKSFERRLNIGLVVVLEDALINNYVTQILDGMVGYNGRGCIEMTIILYRVSDKFKSLLQTIRERRCDAVVIVPPEPVADQLDDLIEAEIPTMLINGDRTGPKMGCIGNDSYAGAVKAMEYLIACGHRKIGFLCNSLKNGYNHVLRLQAYKDVLARNGIIGKPSWIIPHHPTEQTAEAGFDQCRALLKHAPEVTAIFCTNDEMAMGAIKACWEFNRKVPDDISIIGFDGIPYCSYLHPALTTVRQPLSELGKNAVRYLEEFLKGSRVTLPVEMLQTELVVRDSVTSIY